MGLKRILLWVSGLGTGIFLMVGDELINFAQCCKNENYPFPLIGSYSVWASWEIAFGAIIGFTILGLVVVGHRD
jgi:hypothetical protein